MYVVISVVAVFFSISLIPVSLFFEVNVGEFTDKHLSINSCFLGILGNGYDVKYTFTGTCAPTGSVVDIPCTYTYPTPRKVDKAFWFVKWEKNKEPEDLCDSEEYRNRAGYLGNKLHNCTLKIKDLRETDSQKYRFKFIFLGVCFSQIFNFQSAVMELKI